MLSFSAQCLISLRPKSVTCSIHRLVTTQLDDLRLPWQINIELWMYSMPCRVEGSVRKNKMRSKIQLRLTLIKSWTSEAMNMLSSLISSFSIMSCNRSGVRGGEKIK